MVLKITWTTENSVKINNTNSEYLQVNFGISISERLLLILHVNDLPKVIRNSIHDSNVTNETKRALHQDLTSVIKWLSLHRLHLNINKTMWTLFGTWERLRLSKQTEMCINGEMLEHLNEYK